MATKEIITATCAGVLTAVISLPAAAETLQAKLDRLERVLTEQEGRLAAQDERISRQAETISRQDDLLKQQRTRLDSLRTDFLDQSRGRGVSGALPAASESDFGPASPPRETARLSDMLLTQADQPAPSNQPKPKPQAETAPKPVGQAPPKEKKKEEPPEVQAIADVGGVLTPMGKLVIEPSVQYSHASVNRFTFRGIEILSSFLIGALEAEDADRDVWTVALTGRYGITNRLELEAKVPYVWRDDTVTTTIPRVAADPDDPTETGENVELDGNGLGDVEVALHYQINRGLNGWPFFIGNVRYKSDTGRGPFDVDRDENRNANELAVGSGFHSVEPSLTVLWPSDPAVFFANVGYLWNFKSSIDDTVNVGSGIALVEEVDPGNAYRFSLGMAYAINEKTSFTLGYKNDFIQKTKTTINGVTVKSSTLNIGSALLGFAFQATPRLGVNVNFELGITADAPDVFMTLRVPWLVDLF